MYWYVLELCGGVSEICVLPNTAGKLLWEFVSKKGYLASRIFPVSLFLQVRSLAAMLKTNLLVKMFLGSSFAKVLWPDYMKNALKWVATSVMLDGKQDFIYMALSLLWHSFTLSATDLFCWQMVELLSFVIMSQNKVINLYASRQPVCATHYQNN